jgi:hypothetical protein
MKIQRSRLHQIIREEIARVRAIRESKGEQEEEEGEVQPDGYIVGPDALASEDCGCGCASECGCK